MVTSRCEDLKSRPIEPRTVLGVVLLSCRGSLGPRIEHDLLSWKDKLMCITGKMAKWSLVFICSKTSAHQKESIILKSLSRPLLICTTLSATHIVPKKPNTCLQRFPSASTPLSSRFSKTRTFGCVSRKTVNSSKWTSRLIQTRIKKNNLPSYFLSSETRNPDTCVSSALLRSASRLPLLPADVVRHGSWATRTEHLIVMTDVVLRNPVATFSRILSSWLIIHGELPRTHARMLNKRWHVFTF